MKDLCTRNDHKMACSYKITVPTRKSSCVDKGEKSKTCWGEKDYLYVILFFSSLTVHMFFHLSQKDSPCAGAEDRPSIILWPQTDSRGLIDGVGEDVNIPPACH